MGGSRGRKLRPEDKGCAIRLVNDAKQQGCRKNKACDALRLSLRTLQRWAKLEDVSDKRQGPKTLASHALTALERASIIKVANQPEFACLPPSQIVPKLADKGQYIASESSFYRVLKSVKQLCHRGRQKPPKHKM